MASPNCLLLLLLGWFVVLYIVSQAGGMPSVPSTRSPDICLTHSFFSIGMMSVEPLYHAHAHRTSPVFLIRTYGLMVIECARTRGLSIQVKISALAFLNELPLLARPVISLPLLHCSASSSSSPTLDTAP